MTGLFKRECCSSVMGAACANLMRRPWERRSIASRFGSCWTSGRGHAAASLKASSIAKWSRRCAIGCAFCLPVNQLYPNQQRLWTAVQHGHAVNHRAACAIRPCWTRDPTTAGRKQCIVCNALGSLLARGLLKRSWSSALTQTLAKRLDFIYRRRDLIYDLEHKFLRLNESEPGESPSASTSSSSHNGDNTDKRGKRCRPVQEQAEAASSDERQVQLPSSDVGPSGVMAGPSGVMAAECGMCLEPMEERWALVPCGHTQYCIRCIDTLEHEQKPLCPECRGDIKKKMRIYM